MTSTRSQDISLYELALSAEEPPNPLQISPSTFRSMVNLFFDLLIDQQIPAKLWMKLPKGDIWQGELDRYRKSINVPYSIYSLGAINSPVRETDGSETAGVALPSLTDQADEDGLVSDQGMVPEAAAELTLNSLLEIAAENQLRREYFLLVLSERFCGLILAHRPRTVRPGKDDVLPEADLLNRSKSIAMVDDEAERKHPLLGLCSFEPVTLQRVLAGVHQAIETSYTQDQSSHAVGKLLAEWDTVTSAVQTCTNEPALMGSLLTKQIYQQELLWRSNTSYRKQAETGSAIQMSNEELLNSIRLKDEFLKNVGQELRTPLATMKTALTLLSSPSLKPPQRQRYMDMLSQECDRQSALITSVLDLIQLENAVEQTPMQPLRLVDIVPGVVSTYQPLAQEKGILLAYTISDDLPTVACSAASLRQIVINLLHNGIKFTPSGGQVWVRAKQQGDYVQVEVRDTGIGIPTNEIPKIFDRFYRVRSPGLDDPGGAGLGLSIVQQLLLRCGGSISVRSKPGEGSTFVALLPLYQ